MSRKLLISFVAVAMAACVAEARPRRGNPATGQVLNGVLQGISQAQRDAERRARQEEANRQRREKEWQRQQQAEQRRLQKEADNRARQLEIQRKKAEADAAKAEAMAMGGNGGDRWDCSVYYKENSGLKSKSAFVS